jgi:uncharacterized membrane protein
MVRGVDRHEHVSALWRHAFDPYPFGLLTMVVSLEAIFLTIMVLISQNRMTMQAAMLRMLERITVHLGLPVEGDFDTLATRTDVEQLMTELDAKLPANRRPPLHRETAPLHRAERIRQPGVGSYQAIVLARRGGPLSVGRFAGRGFVPRSADVTLP